MTGDGRDMYPGQDELPASEPGLEHVLGALTAEGDATELVSRQAALTMFRAARAQAATPGLAGQGQPAPGEPTRGRPTWGTPTVPAGRRAGSFRRTATARRPRRFPLTAGIAVFLAGAVAGMAFAAYSAALPPSIQNVAHSVFAPLGVPSAAPASTPSVGPGSGSGPANITAPASGPGTGNGTTSPNGPGSSPTASPTATSSASSAASSAASRVSMSMTVASNPVSFGVQDVFTGHVRRNGHAGRLVRVRLLEQLSNGTGAWRVVATGLTNANGTVVLVGPRTTVDAIFVIKGAGKLASVGSAPVDVTVRPHVAMRIGAAHVLTVTVWPAAAGDPADLQVRRDGTWQLVAVLHLAAHKATYKVTPGKTYRVSIPATSGHDAAVSASVVAPGAAAPSGGATATSTASVGSTATARSKPATSRSASASPTPSVTPAVYALLS